MLFSRLTRAISNRIFFVYLHGAVLAEAASAEALTNAMLRITLEATLDSGGSQDPVTYEIPLKMTAFGVAHLSVRNATGAYSESLTSDKNDNLADYWRPGMFLQTGWWTSRSRMC